ncbi:MAG: thiamine-phosphate pyrophosphorylase [Candidatus Omnitrophota bacterium]
MGTRRPRSSVKSGTSAADRYPADSRRPVFRIIDANLNRAAEGLRVCEDIARFYLRDKRMRSALKKIRHELKRARAGKDMRLGLLMARSVAGDIGRRSHSDDLSRRDLIDVLTANAARVKEALRSLEEVSKLVDRGVSERFKALRFRFYNEEKRIVRKTSRHGGIGRP